MLAVLLKTHKEKRIREWNKKAKWKWVLGMRMKIKSTFQESLNSTHFYDVNNYYYSSFRVKQFLHYLVKKKNIIKMEWNGVGMIATFILLFQGIIMSHNHFIIFCWNIS